MIIGIFAVDDNGNVGNNGGMPWPPNKEDFKWFRTTTLNQVVVMGKATWNSPDMPKPLPNRINVVITNSPDQVDDVIYISGDLPFILSSLNDRYKEDIYVIGGVNILLQSKSVLEKLYITRIPSAYIADTTLNLESFLEDFKLISTKELGSCKVEEYETIQRST